MTLNGISVTGDFPASTANTLTYTVVEGDAIAGQATIQVKRADSDIKFGTISVERENVIPSTDPVASVTVDGPATGAIGFPVTFTANTDVKANAYKWYVDGVEQAGATEKTFVFTPAAEQTYLITAAAKNDNNADFVISAGVNLVVTKLCGELIKATHVNKNTATVTGVVGGTADRTAVN